MHYQTHHDIDHNLWTAGLSSTQVWHSPLQLLDIYLSDISEIGAQLPQCMPIMAKLNSKLCMHAKC